MEVSTDSTIQPETMYDYINGLFLNPSALIIIGLVVAGYIIIFFSLGKSGESGINIGENPDGTSVTGTNILMGIVALIFVILFVTNVFQYFFGINVIASLKNVATGVPEIDIVVDETTKQDYNPNSNMNPLPPDNTLDSTGQIRYTEQVFNIPENTYGYEDAKSLCTAYGARLATYTEVEDAYKKGGEWCNYGWSDGQMALFPTQKETYDGLQKIKGHEQACGRPGITGGYMSNPLLKFGVNCYGYKPRMTGEEEQLMEVSTPYPKSEKDILFEKRVDYWKSKLGEILVSPFNYNSWSKI